MITKKAIHRCVQCSRQDGLTMLAHRDTEGYIVGWLMCCVDCHENVCTQDISFCMPAVGTIKLPKED